MEKYIIKVSKYFPWIWSSVCRRTEIHKNWNHLKKYQNEHMIVHVNRHSFCQWSHFHFTSKVVFLSNPVNHIIVSWMLGFHEYVFILPKTHEKHIKVVIGNVKSYLKSKKFLFSSFVIWLLPLFIIWKKIRGLYGEVYNFFHHI